MGCKSLSCNHHETGSDLCMTSYLCIERTNEGGHAIEAVTDPIVGVDVVPNNVLHLT